MPVITTLDTLMERVMEEHARNYDLLANTALMSVGQDEDGLVQLAVDSVDDERGIEDFEINDHALGQMATDLGIPKRYFDRMKDEAPGLFQTNVHHWFQADAKRRMLRAKRGGERPVLRAWLSDRYRRLDNIEIATKLLPEFARLEETIEFHQASITDSKFFLRAVFPRMKKEVKVGDAVQWGVQIRNSEVGAGTFAIESFVNRLVCTNGMVVAKVLNARHVGKRLDESLSDEAIRADDRAFWLAARDVLRASISETEFERVVEALKATTEGALIRTPIKATERLAKTYSLSEGEQEAVLLQLSMGGEMDRWGALNAVTAAAKGSEHFDRQVEMEEIGWDLATLTEREWSRIAVGT